MIKKTADSVQDYPKDASGRISFSKIPDVMEVPNLLALNFILHGSLGGHLALAGNQSDLRGNPDRRRG